MSSFDINGVKVTFPFEPYDIQKNYMKKVIEALQNSSNAVLESPTGTGKTLSLLCSSLAWLMNEKMKFNISRSQRFTEDVDGTDTATSLGILNWRLPKIIYSSRTHSQLSQVMQELKQTIYKDVVRSAIIGSREQLCLKQEVLNEPSNSNQINLCRHLVKSRGCSYHFGVEKHKGFFTAETRVIDIEDLMKSGKRQHFCPYYMAREIKQEADITFMPYNYILDSSLRQINGIDLNNCIIIFDEAHNIERICEDAASIEITSTDIAMAIQELTHLMKYMDDTHNDMIVEDDSPKAFTFDDLITMKSLLLEFEKAVDEIPVKFDGDTYEASYINQLLSKAGINALELSQLAITSDRVFQYLSSTRQEILNRSGVYIERLRNLFSKVNEHSTDPDKVNKCFKVHIREVTVSKGGKAAPGSGGWQSKFDTKKQKIISYWCFSPSFGIDILLRNGVRNIILTSGTLAPLNPLIAELGIDVKCRLENPHIVSKDQVLIKIVKNGFQNVLLDSSFKNRDNPSYIQSLGKTIQAFAGMIPGGLLVFFPSYPILNQCVEAWKQDSSWLAINKRKPIFIEPRDKTSFVNVMSQYYEQIKASDSTGACFFAVCRGKVSEGLDFADLNGRGVIITGLPFPPLKDPKVVIKRKYLDENLNRTLNGSQWYTLEATKAVNQAIGRVIRHRNDYGAILLCDHRFDSPNLRNDLSSWVRNLIEVTNTFPGAISGVAKFFHLAQAKYSNSISTPTVPAIIKSEPLPQPQQHLYSIEESAASSSKKIESIMSEYKSEHVPANSKSKFNLFNVSHNENSGFQFRSSDISENSSGLVKINDNPRKKRKINIVANTSTENEQKNLKSTMESLIQKLKEKLTIDKNKLLIKAILDYKSSRNIYNFIKQLHEVLEFVTDSEHYLRDISEFISSCDKSEFFKYIALRTKWDNLSLDARKNDSYKNYCLCK